MTRNRKIAQVDSYCVACGTCVKECPLQAITIFRGLNAVIDADKCVGCGRCSRICPASSIQIVNRGENV